MIGKAAATGEGFRGLIAYLVHGKLGKQQPDRVAWRDVRNLMSDDPTLVTRIMRSTASRSRRCLAPVYHLVISWRNDENPTPDLMRQVADTTLADLELAEHQAYLLAHDDTAHKHLHIVVNRVHPDTGRAWTASHDYRRIEQSIGRQAKALSLIYVPGRHNEPEKFTRTPKRPRSPEQRMAERLGTTDQLRPRWTLEQIAGKRQSLIPIFEKARSWSELTRALAKEGLTLETKGQGLVIGDATGTMKLSDLQKQIRLPGLEAKFGETWRDYSARREQPQRTPEPWPTSAEDDATAVAKAAPMPEPFPGATDDDAQAKPAPAQDHLPRSPRDRTEPPAEESPADDGADASAAYDRQQPARPQERQPITPQPPRQPTHPIMDRAEFRARWEKRAAEVMRQRAEENRRSGEAMKAKEAREVEERRRREEAARARTEPSARAPAPTASPQPVQRHEPTPPAKPETQAAAPPVRSPEAEARDAAYDAKEKADAEADLAFKLHAAGLVTRKQLAHSVRAREEAQAEIDKTADLRQTIGKEVREALKPGNKPPPRKRPDRFTRRRSRNRDGPDR